MNLSIEDWELLNNYIGAGPIDKVEVIFFGNEFGLARSNIENYLNFIKKFIKEERHIFLEKDFDEGFMLVGEKPISLNSPFVRFCSQFMLAYNNNDDRFLDRLTKKGVIYVNKYIMEEFHRVNSAVINLRPLPRPSEEHWIYDNINKNNYLRSYKFSPKQKEFDKNVKPRIENLLRAFNKAPNPLIIGTGDKWNKRNLFERVLPEVNFEEITLSTTKKILLDIKQKILLCDYFDQRVLEIKSLKEMFNILKKENII